MNGDMKMYVHVYNQKKGIAFMEITDGEIKEEKVVEDAVEEEVVEDRTQL